MAKKKKKQQEKKDQKRKSDKVRYPLAFAAIAKHLDRAYIPFILGGIYFLLMLYFSFKYHVVGDYGVETDFFGTYVPHAKKFLEGHIHIEKFRGPMYPIVLGIIGFLTGNFFKGGILLNLISAGVVLAFVYKLIGRLFRADLAFFITLLMAVNTYFIQYTYSAGTDMFFLALAVGSIYCLLRQDKLRWGYLVLGAVLAGMAYLTRYNGLFLIIGYLLGILFINPLSLTWKKRIAASLVTVVVFFAVIAPWGFYCLQEKGSFFFNENYKNIAYEYYAKGKMSWDEFWMGQRFQANSLPGVVMKDPGAFFSKMISNVRSHLKKDLGSLVGSHVGVLSIAGFLLLFFNPPSRRQLTYYLFAVLFFGVLLLVFYNERFSMFLIPFYGVLGLQVFSLKNKGLGRLMENTRIGAWLILIIVIWTFLYAFKYNRKQIDAGPQDVLKVAEWIKTNVPGNREKLDITARKPHIAYYAGMNYKRLPYVKSYREFLRKLRKKDIEYIYFGVMEAQTRRPLQFLIDPRKAPPELKPVTFFNNPPVVLYKVRNK